MVLVPDSSSNQEDDDDNAFYGEEDGEDDEESLCFLATVSPYPIMITVFALLFSFPYYKTFSYVIWVLV